MGLPSLGDLVLLHWKVIIVSIRSIMPVTGLVDPHTSQIDNFPNASAWKKKKNKNHDSLLSGSVAYVPVSATLSWTTRRVVPLDERCDSWLVAQLVGAATPEQARCSFQGSQPASKKASKQHDDDPLVRTTRRVRARNRHDIPHRELAQPLAN